MSGRFRHIWTSILTRVGAQEVLPSWCRAKSLPCQIQPMAGTNGYFSEAWTNPESPGFLGRIWVSCITPNAQSSGDSSPVLQRNIHSFQPSAESGNGIDLARHRRGQESFLLNACQIDVQIWRKRPDMETLKEFGINDRFHAFKNGRPRQRADYADLLA